MKRLGLIGDVHAEDDLLEAALFRLSTEKVDAILCVGDITDGQGSVDRCVELLEKHHVLAVKGNHDRWMLKDEMRDLSFATMREDITPTTRAYLRELPATRRIGTSAGPLLLCHAFGEHDMIFVDDFLGGLEPLDEKELRARRSYLSRLIPKDISLVVAGHDHRHATKKIGRLKVFNTGTLRRDKRSGFSILDLETLHTRWFDL